MRIAIITSGMLPVPAVQGGAVENLIDYLLEFNNQKQLHDITIYSAFHHKVKKHHALQSIANHYEYIHTRSLLFKIGAKLFARKQHTDYYYYQIEYFLECAIKKMSRRSFDLIIIENRPGFAIRLSQVFTTPIITHIHTNLLHIPSEENYEVLKATKGFIVVSEYIKDEINKLGIKKNIKVVYNGLDTRIFCKTSIKPIQREEFGLSKNDFVVIYWGRLVPEKGIKDLLLAMLKLKCHKDIKLMVIGSVNYEDSKDNTSAFLEELKELSLKTNKSIIFTGYIPYKKIPNYLSIANVAVIPSQINEAFGMTCIEACAMGLPVIATKDGGIPEALYGQKHILLDKNSYLPQTIYDAILKIKNNYSQFEGNFLSSVFQKEHFADTFFSSLSSFQ